MRIEGAAVQDNPAELRFEMDTSAGPVVANYRLDGDLLAIFHTEARVSFVVAASATGS